MSKTVCGITIEGSTANIVTLTGTRSDHQRVGIAFRKITLQDQTQGAVHSFRETLDNFFRNEDVSLVGIEARQTKGIHCGGPMSFKIEAIVQSLGYPVELVHPASVRATMKKNTLDLEPHNLFQYQVGAYQLAYHLLEA